MHDTSDQIEPIDPLNIEPVPRVSLSTLEAAESLGVCERTVQKMISSGAGFPHFRIGNRVLVPIEGLREWALQKTKATRAKAG